ncbi:MAG: type ISP restriction/modification enzyme, partial [Candidatus Binatia bacterium]
HTGVNSNRNWVWAPNVATLRRRWSTLIHASSADKAALFKETDTCSLDRRCDALLGLPSGEQPVREERKAIPATVRVAFRSFDRQYLIHDRRVIDRPRPELWQVLSETQIYVSEQHAHSFTHGTALTFSALVPNVHHFNNRGGRALPLYRDRKSREPNVAPGLLTTLSRLIGMQLNAEDFLAYIAAVVAHPIYTRRFRDKLTTPGIRVPISAHAELWQEAIAIGSEVLWLHTYGERYVDPAAGRPHETPTLPSNERPIMTVAIPGSEEQMPNSIKYDAESKTIIIGEHPHSGRITQVNPSIWEYTVGGYQVVPRWFSYRQRNPSRKKRTSALDEINPTCWTVQFDDELLALLNVLGRCVALEPRQADLLDRVCDGPSVTIADLERQGVLPVPDAFCKPPPLLPQDRIPGLDEL